MNRRARGVASVVMLIALLVLALLTAVLVSLQVTTLEGSVGHLQTARAFYIAEGAMQYVIEYELNSDTDWSNNTSPTATYNGDYNHGPYLTLGEGRAWVRYLNQTLDTVDIEVTGCVGSAVRVLQEHLTVSIPATFQNVQFSTGNINMNNSSGNSNGDVTAVGTANIGSAVTVSGDVASGSTLQIPTVDFDFYKAHANQVVNGNLDFTSGTYGDAVNGYIWYVTGNVRIDGNTTINGTIVTEGDLIAQNPKTNYTFKAIPKNVDADPEAEQMPALVIKSNWNFDNVNNLTIYGLVYALGNINLSNSDHVTLNGALVTNGNMNINNASYLNLTYDASYVTSLPGFQSQGAVAVVVSRWEEVP